MITGARLLVVQGRPQGKSLQFPVGEFVFGRGAECQIRPNSVWVSRQHCLLRVTPTVVTLRDLGSRNGTLVNGTRVTDERPLAAGDQVQLGPLVFEVQLVEQPAAAGQVTPFTADTVDEAEHHTAGTDQMPAIDPEGGDWSITTPPG